MGMACKYEDSYLLGSWMNRNVGGNISIGKSGGNVSVIDFFYGWNRESKKFGRSNDL